MTSCPLEQGSYFRYRTADWNHPAAYPIGPRPDPLLYHPAAAWIGRLLLPDPKERRSVVGAWMEIEHAEPPYAHLIGCRVRLRWDDTPETNQRFWSVTRPVQFDTDAEQCIEKGYVLPERVNGWPRVNPFESLAGAYPTDEMIVRLPEPVIFEESPTDGGAPILFIPREPVQTTGRFYALVRFLKSEDASTAKTRWRVVHYNRTTKSFDGPQETVLLPETVPNRDGIQPSVSIDIDRSPANTEGWYIYGALNAAGQFVVQSLMPRGLMCLQPQETVTEPREKHNFFQLKTWRKKARQGTVTTTLLCPDGVSPDVEISAWREGDAALLIHLYGKYLRKDWFWQRFLLTWGHFAFGIARVIREPLTGELRFDIEYNQIYVHGEEGIISGTHHWTRYLGDRQFGFLGIHPTQDTLIRMDCLTEPYSLPEAESMDGPLSPLAELSRELEMMAARYRIADGRGGARISPSNNCAQDSNQALYAALKHIGFALRSYTERTVSEQQRIAQLIGLGRDLKHKLLPFGAARADWEYGTPTIGSSLAEKPLSSALMAIRTWHTMLPSVAVRYLAEIFLRHGASAWVLRTHQVGGLDPTLEPRIPNV